MDRSALFAGLIALGLIMIVRPCPAQRFIPAFMPRDVEGRADWAAGEPDRELRILGERIRRRHEEAIRLNDVPCLLVIAREHVTSSVEHRRSPARSVTFEVEVRLPPETEGGPWAFVQYHQVHTGASFSDAGDLSERLTELLLARPASWHCMAIDERDFYYWSSDPREVTSIAPRARPRERDPLQGFPIEVAGHRTTPVAGPPHVFDTLLGSHRRLQEKLVRFLHHARVSPEFRWSLEDHGAGDESLVVWQDLAPSLRDSSRSGHLITEIDVASGLLRSVQQELKGRGDDRRTLEDITTIVVRGASGPSGSQLRIPCAVQEIRSGTPEPGGTHDLGLMEFFSVMLVLDVRLEPSDLNDHSALSTDSLAAWIGVPLRWKISCGAEVTSIPDEMPEELAIPNNAELRRVAEELTTGRLTVEYPFEYRGAQSLDSAGDDGSGGR